jgi:hypothetical protein
MVGLGEWKVKIWHYLRRFMEIETSNAALKQLRHPKSQFFREVWKQIPPLCFRLPGNFVRSDKIYGY